MSAQEIRERMELLEDARERAAFDEDAADLVDQIEGELYQAGALKM